MTPKLLKSTGRSFSGVIRYNEKNASELLGIENFPADDVELLQDCLEYYTAQNGRIKDAVLHATLPFPPGEVLDSDTYLEIARDYMQGMGYGEQPYAVYLHTDKAHLHLHVVSSRVNFSDPAFKKIDDYNEHWRSLCVGAIVERRHGITKVLDEKLPTFLRHRVDEFFEQSKSIGEFFSDWRAMQKGQKFEGQRQRREALSMSNELVLQVNEAVSAAMREKPRSVAQLQKLLAPQHVEVREAVNKKTGKRQGVLFVFHRQDAKNLTAEMAEKGIPSCQLQCFKRMPLMQVLQSNRKTYKAAQSYVRKHLSEALKTAKNNDEFQLLLSQKNVATTWHENARGLYGVSFTYKDVTLKGSEIDKTRKRFTFEKISEAMKKNNIAFDFALKQAQAQPVQATPSLGSLSGAGGSSHDDEDEEEYEIDEITGERVKKRKQKKAM
jgi:hypothetical protein